MNKQLSIEEVSDLITSIADKPKPVPMTKKQRLWRWSDLVYNHKYKIEMMHGIEYLDIHQLRRVRVQGSIFDVAANDPVLQKEGLKDNTAGASIDFFSLTRDELHHLSCDCHGPINNLEMAHRIRQIA